MENEQTARIGALKSRIARLQAGPERRDKPGIGFGVAAIDAALPMGLQGALHEIVGTGAETEHGAAASLFAAGILARARGPVLWVLEHADLFAPALAGVGLHPDRVIFVEAGRGVLAAMEEGARQPGLAGVVGETGARITLTASRRLQLAAEGSGVTVFALRRFRVASAPALAEPNAAVTRWRVAALPSPPPLPHAPDVPGLARARWRLDLVRCRGGAPATWTVEACDAQGRLALVTDLPHRSAAPGQQRATG
jgi:protein ImuA